jgi:hypothetical protein
MRTKTIHHFNIPAQSEMPFVNGAFRVELFSHTDAFQPCVAMLTPGEMAHLIAKWSAELARWMDEAQ